MDVVLQIFWERDRGTQFSGSIITCREIIAGSSGQVWTGTEYVPRSPIGNTQFIVIYITGVPVTDAKMVQYALEQQVVDADGNIIVKRKWIAKADALTSAEQEQVLQHRYITLTWERFKQVCVDYTGTLSFTDDDLLVDEY